MLHIVRKLLLKGRKLLRVEVIHCLLASLQDMFEQVNKAYEFLCSRTKITEGPDPKNIVLILKAQSILFSRYSPCK